MPEQHQTQNGKIRNIGNGTAKTWNTKSRTLIYRTVLSGEIAKPGIVKHGIPNLEKYLRFICTAPLRQGIHIHIATQNLILVGGSVFRKPLWRFAVTKCYNNTILPEFKTYFPLSEINVLLMLSSKVYQVPQLKEKSRRNSFPFHEMPKLLSPTTPPYLTIWLPCFPLKVTWKSPNKVKLPH